MDRDELARTARERGAVDMASPEARGRAALRARAKRAGDFSTFVTEAPGGPAERDADASDPKPAEQPRKPVEAVSGPSGSIPGDSGDPDSLAAAEAEARRKVAAAATTWTEPDTVTRGGRGDPPKRKAASDPDSMALAIRAMVDSLTDVAIATEWERAPEAIRAAGGDAREWGARVIAHGIEAGADPPTAHGIIAAVFEALGLPSELLPPPLVQYRERRAAGRLAAPLAQAAPGHSRSGDVLPLLVASPGAGGMQYSLLPRLGPNVEQYAGEFLAAALPVALYTTRGKGAPLDVRMGLEAILSLRPEDRRGSPVSLPLEPWGRWLARIYPGRKVSRIHKHAWPGLARALQALKRDERWDLPVSNGRGGWEIVRAVYPLIHPGTGHPSERLLMSVTLPASGRRGGVTDRRVVRLAGQRSTAALALATGLSVLWDQPSELRHKEGGRYVQIADPGAYPLIGWPGVVSLMYPGGPPKRKYWPGLLDEARQLLDWLTELEYLTWTREPGGRRIMPGAKWPGWKPDQREIIQPPK